MSGVMSDESPNYLATIGDAAGLARLTKYPIVMRHFTTGSRKDEFAPSKRLTFAQNVRERCVNLEIADGLSRIVFRFSACDLDDASSPINVFPPQAAKLASARARKQCNSEHMPDIASTLGLGSCFAVSLRLIKPCKNPS
jgi:hypothetical protein